MTYRVPAFVLLAFLWSCAEAELPAPFAADVVTEVLPASESGREFQVSVALPLGYDTASTPYSVLYAVDANGQLGTVIEAARILRLGGQIPPLLIVGIGYPTGGRQILARERRLYDLFPTKDADWEEATRRAAPNLPPPEGSGGAPDFLAFLADDVIPWVEDNFKASTDRRGLYGHSAGGLFGLYALMHGDGLFSRFIVGSPSLWWDDRWAFSAEEAYSTQRTDLPATVFMSVGSDEPDEHHEDEGGWGRMVTNFRDFIAVLEARNYSGLVLTHHYFEGENHQSVVPATVSRGLRTVYGEPSRD